MSLVFFVWPLISYLYFSVSCRSYEALHWLTHKLTQASFFSTVSDLHLRLQVATQFERSAELDSVATKAMGRLFWDSFAWYKLI